MPAGRLVVVIVSAEAAGLMTMLRAFVALVVALSVTVTKKLDEAAAVGVPEITPLEASRLRPVGRVPELTDQA